MKTITIICVGLVGCLLTSIAGISGSMLMRGWDSQGGWSEWLTRLAISYPFSCLVVVIFFPVMIPKLNAFFESIRIFNKSDLN